MFNSLSGTINGARGDRLLLQGDGGIEWEIEAGARTIAACLSRRGDVDRHDDDRSDGEDNGHDRRPVERTRLFVYLYHREDQMRLYGFIDEDERMLFLELIRVSGVGPRLALKILSGMGTDDLRRAIQNSDHLTLSHIPGLGTKTAQKLILALRGKVDLSTATGPLGDRGSGDEIINALTEMGYDQRAARQVVNTLRQQLQQEGVPQNERDRELLRRAIVALSASG